MNKEQIVQSLRLFNEKAEKLQASTFLKSAIAGSGFNMKASIGNPVEVTRSGPNQENIDAFVLTFRFFIQDNELSSFRNLAEVYKDVIIPPEFQGEFKKARDFLNTFLDKPSHFRPKNKVWTRRQILETFVYGGLAHAESSKKKDYDEWMANPIIGPLLTNELVFILCEVLKAILYVKQVNGDVLNSIDLLPKNFTLENQAISSIKS